MRGCIIHIFLPYPSFILFSTSSAAKTPSSFAAYASSITVESFIPFLIRKVCGGALTLSRAFLMSLYLIFNSRATVAAPMIFVALCKPKREDFNTTSPSSFSAIVISSPRGVFFSELTVMVW